jgi:lipopolysaccharide assembly protein A
MRILTWSIRLLLFVLVLALAAKNTEPVTVRFYFDFASQLPLAVALLVFLVAGVVLGLLASLRVVLRQRRTIAELQKSAKQAAAVAPPHVDA